MIASIPLFKLRIEEYKRNGMSIKLELQKLLVIMQQKKGFLEAYFTDILEKLDSEFKLKQSTVLEKFQSNE